jgi:hypothetical protein
MCEEGYVTERIQDLYDAHGIRPNTFSLIRLIDNFLKQGIHMYIYISIYIYIHIYIHNYMHP